MSSSEKFIEHKQISMIFVSLEVLILLDAKMVVWWFSHVVISGL